MAALKKGVAFSVGLVTASCSINGAVDKAAGNVTCCTGNITDHTGKPTAAHDPIRLSTVRRCTDCGDVPYADVKKAREVPGGLALITDEEIATAKGDVEKYKTAMAMTPHPASTVYARTAPGEKAYYVTPDPGHETAYALLVAMIGAHPEFAFVGQWVARSNVSQFRVTVRDGCLMMVELVREQQIKQPPVITATAPEAMLAMAEQVLTLPGVVTDYDPETYASHYEDNVQALLASKQVHATGTAPAASSSTPSLPAGQQAAMDALAAMLADAAPAPKPTRKKKVTTA